MSIDVEQMARAMELAVRGEGCVEPNPMVGCVIVRDGRRIGEGWHREFGGPHAEIEALASVTGKAAGATMYVTLEPCCHTGKTPPCTQAVIEAGIARVIVAHEDPFPKVAGRGIEALRQAGIEVEVGLLRERAQQIVAPFQTLVVQKRPWVIAKWAMTLDGKIASRTGHSQWISGAQSRDVVHQLRRRVDAVMVGRRTAETDNPLLTARPPGKRTVTRVIVDSRASLSPDSQLVQTSNEASVLVAVGPEADPERQAQLRKAGCEVIPCRSAEHPPRLRELLAELGRRQMTNLLVEGGGMLLGSFFDQNLIDEVHVFVAPKLVGGQESPSPLGGLGRELVPQLPSLLEPNIRILDQDVYVSGRVARAPLTSRE